MTKQMKLVGLAGGARDAITEHLTNEHRYGHYGFDWPVLSAVSAGFGIDPDDINSDTPGGIAGSFDSTPIQLQHAYRRWWLQAFRSPDLIHAWHALRIVSDAPEMQDLDGIVFCDVSTPEQAGFIRRRGGVVVDCRLDSDKPGGPLQRWFRRLRRRWFGIEPAAGRHALSSADVDLVLLPDHDGMGGISLNTLYTLHRALGMEGANTCH